MSRTWAASGVSTAGPCTLEASLHAVSANPVTAHLHPDPKLHAMRLDTAAAGADAASTCAACRDDQLDRRMTLLWESNSTMSIDLCAHIACAEEVRCVTVGGADTCVKDVAVVMGCRCGVRLKVSVLVLLLLLLLLLYCSGRCLPRSGAASAGAHGTSTTPCP
jgi:hypothetical protein